MLEKKEYRRIVAERRALLSAEEILERSRRIMEKILRLPFYKETETVFAYMSLPGEVQLQDFLIKCWAEGKRTAVPKISGKEMHFYRIDSFGNLSPGAMSILEPDPAICPLADGEENALMIMPGLAFDRERHRIGYGGGYYDRYLEKHRSHKTIAVSFEFQLFDQLPMDDLDIVPDLLITDQEEEAGRFL